MLNNKNDRKNKSYDVGYGKPPQDTRFQPGQSGNAKGRPRGAKNLATIVNNAINEKVVVTENGKRRKKSKLEIAVTQLINKAVIGDQKALTQLIPLVQIIEGRAEADAASTPHLSEVDDQVMSHIGERFRQSVLQKIVNQDQQTETNKVSNKEDKS
ncbi:MAG: DUF5681 domain-containing protein [Desulfomonilia bacterium]